MAKKKKKKVIPLLSPENYIRQKARNLPVYECWLNSKWKEEGLAYITISRRHTTGNLTMGIFLVDLRCLGVKDAGYSFNISESEYTEHIAATRERMNIEKTSYTLVHNIVYAGIEYAEEFGFKPHKDYTSVAGYLLEEDTDEIELIEIECGSGGKPLYIPGPFEDERRISQVLSQLERTAGPGNFDYIAEMGQDDWDDLDEPGDDEQEEKFGHLSVREKMDVIKEKMDRLDELSDAEKKDLNFLFRSVLDVYIDYEKVDEIFQLLLEKLDRFEITDEPSDELLGIKYNPGTNRDEWKELFLEVHRLISEHPKKASEKVARLQKEMPGNPAVAFLELNLLLTKESADYPEKLKNYQQHFPEYPLFKILGHAIVPDENQRTAEEIFREGPERFFTKRKSIHTFELFHYLFFLAILASAEKDIALIEVIDWIKDEVEISDWDYEVLARLILISRLKFVISLEENDSEE